MPSSPTSTQSFQIVFGELDEPYRHPLDHTSPGATHLMILCFACSVGSLEPCKTPISRPPAWRCCWRDLRPFPASATMRLQDWNVTHLSVGIVISRSD